MRDLQSIQGDNRQRAVNQLINDIVAGIEDLIAKGAKPSLVEGPNATVALERHDLALDNAARQRNNAQLYYALVNLVGAVKAAGWPYEQYAKAEKIVESIEFSATGRKLDAGVPAGYSVAA